MNDPPPPSHEAEAPEAPHHHNLQLVPFNPNSIEKDNHSPTGVTSVASNCFAFAVNPDFPVINAHDETTMMDALSHAVILIPPSSSDLSEASVAPSTVNINLKLTSCPAKFDEKCENETIATATSATTATTMTTTEKDLDENKPPPKQLKRSASFTELTEKGVDFDTFDRIRMASAGVEFQAKQNPRLRMDHRPSFGPTIDNVKWFHHRKNKRPCPPAGWLTRMARGETLKSVTADAGTPANGVFRTTNGFTFQC